MGFQQGLSGLNAASRNLDVIGHNIANANTVGMKASRAEFADLYAKSINTAATSSPGLGVTVSAVTQMFTQGNITNTGNELDVAINGNGFFQLQNQDESNTYSRAGQFKLDRDGNIVNNQGAKLLGHPPGAVTIDTPKPLTLPTAKGVPAKVTSLITAEFNLDARAVVAATAVPPTPPSTYGTSLVAFDGQGLEVPVGFTFEKTDNNEWAVTYSVNGAPLVPAPTPATQLMFNPDGSLDTVNSTIPATLSLSSVNGPLSIALDFSDVSQYGAAFAVTNLTQDGSRPGKLTSLKIEDNGEITARYSNGDTRSAGQISLATFRNAQGLAPTGGGNWDMTFASGDPQRGPPGSGNLGLLRSGAVEDSNVDLTGELVSMMTAQRAYQANAQTIKTQDQVLSTLLNMR
jgi:flagellar hook protein FlgE